MHTHAASSGTARTFLMVRHTDCNKILSISGVAKVGHTGAHVPPTSWCYAPQNEILVKFENSNHYML